VLKAAVTSRLNKTEIQLESIVLKDAKGKTLRLLNKLAKENGQKEKDALLIDLPLWRHGLARKGALIIKGQK